MGNAAESPKPKKEKTTAKEAANIAAAYYGEVTGDQTGVILEEVELSEDEKFWYITLRHRERGAAAYADRYSFKQFKIDASTGEVLSMKIREV